MATVRMTDREYTIPIECDDPARPEFGLATEPARITREATGRSSGVNLRVRRWQDTDELSVALDRYVAWIPAPSSANGRMAFTLDMSPISVMRDGQLTLLTHELWTRGDRPPGIAGVTIDVDCTTRSPDVPNSRAL
jgi:hypothetical protein